MSGLILLSIGLTALVGALCTLLYTRLSELLRQNRQQQDMMLNLEIAIAELSDGHKAMHKRMDQVATDVLQREIYQNADDSHQLAIQSAKQGRTLGELVQRHGLSSDEAALIVSLHSPKNRVGESGTRNTGLIDPATVDSI